MLPGQDLLGQCPARLSHTALIAQLLADAAPVCKLLNKHQPLLLQKVVSTNRECIAGEPRCNACRTMCGDPASEYSQQD